jgi:hypothetical protein
MWYYTVNNQQVGPVDEKEIKKLVDAGTITHATMVWSTGMANWQPIGQSGLVSLMGAVPPPPVGAYPPMMAVEDPRVTQIKTLFTWYWISLIGIILGGLGLISAAILFVVIVYKSWKLVQHEGVRGSADDMVSRCFIPGWNFYWFFPALRGLAKEFNEKFDRDNIAAERINLDLPTWMIICVFGSGVTMGLSAVAFLVLWIIYTNKIKNAAIAVTMAQK